jgi:hypothetical protein
VTTYENSTADKFINSGSVNICLFTTVSQTFSGTFTKIVRIKHTQKFARAKILDGLIPN